jgi:PAS domain-containing protein
MLLTCWLVMLKLQVRKRSCEPAERNEMLLRAGESLEAKVAQRTADLERAVASLQFEIGERRVTEEALRASEELNRRTMHALPAHIAVLDWEGSILAVDELWMEFAAQNSAAESPDVAAVANYLEVCRRAAVSNDELAIQVLAGIEAVLQGASERFTMEYPCHAPTEKRWFFMSIASLGSGGVEGAVVTHLNITERKQAEKALIESESRFRLLSRTASRLLEAEDPLRVVSELAHGVMEHVDCQAFFNFVVDEQMGKPHLNAFAGIPDDEAQRIEWLDYGVAVCGCVARDGVRIIAEDIRAVYDPRTELVKSYGIQAYASHPPMADGRVIGTLSFGTRTRSSFTPQDLDLMKTVADQVAVAMERMRLVAELERSRNELEARVMVKTAELVQANAELQETARALAGSEERLRRNIELLQKVFDGITDPLLMLDDCGRVTMINRAAMSYYGVGEGANIEEDSWTPPSW